MAAPIGTSPGRRGNPAHEGGAPERHLVAEGASADAINCRNADALARLHPFPNDPNLLFDEASHTYTIFGAVPQRSCLCCESSASTRVATISIL